MKKRDFIHLVGRLEAQSAQRPQAFRAKVLALGLSAYFILFGLLVGVALLIYFGGRWAYQTHHMRSLIHVGLFALVVLPLFYVVLRLFFMRLPAPQGRKITREEAPKLFSVLDKMRKKLNGPTIHHVLIDDEFNASISQLPRFGLLFGHINYLVLGLPYLLGTGPKEMLATVAHEYGHLCGNHGKFSAWIYRQRRIFLAVHQQVMDADADNWTHLLLERVLRWFMPYYDAYTFVLSRQDEYEADRTATEIVGATENASSLIRGDLLGRWIHEEFWDNIYAQAERLPKPQRMPFQSMRKAFMVSYPLWATKERLQQAWLEVSGVVDTHPALRDRVEATGQSAVLPRPLEVTAADVLLGNQINILIDEFDQRWWNAEKKQWVARHHHIVQSTQRLKAFAAQDMRALSAQDLYEYALLSAEFETESVAKPLLQGLLQRQDGYFPKAELWYGKILAKEGSDQCLDYWRPLAMQDSPLREEAARLGYFYLRSQRGEDAAQRWWDEVYAEDDD